MDDNYFTQAYAKLSALPQVVEVKHPEERRCLVNTLNGMVVSLETKLRPSRFFEKKSFEVVGVRISTSPTKIYSQMMTKTSVVLEAQEAVEKLIASWTKQSQ